MNKKQKEIKSIISLGNEALNYKKLFEMACEELGNQTCPSDIHITKGLPCDENAICDESIASIVGCWQKYFKEKRGGEK